MSEWNGVPLNADEDGWHWWFGGVFNELLTPYFYSKGYGPQGRWRGRNPELDGMTYLGPVLTPDEVAALEAHVTELEAALQFIKDAPDEEREPNSNNMGSFEAGVRYCAAVACRALTGGKKDE